MSPFVSRRSTKGDREAAPQPRSALLPPRLPHLKLDKSIFEHFSTTVAEGGSRTKPPRRVCGSRGGRIRFFRGRAPPPSPSFETRCFGGKDRENARSQSDAWMRGARYTVACRRRPFARRPAMLVYRARYEDSRIRVFASSARSASSYAKPTARSGQLRETARLTSRAPRRYVRGRDTPTLFHLFCCVSRRETRTKRRSGSDNNISSR